MECDDFRDSYRQIPVNVCPNYDAPYDYTNSVNPSDLQEDCTTQNDLAFPRVVGDANYDFEILGADSYDDSCGDH